MEYRYLTKTWACQVEKDCPNPPTIGIVLEGPMADTRTVVKACADCYAIVQEGKRRHE